MAIYLGNRKVSVKSGYQTTGMKAYFNAGGKCSNSTFIDLTNILKYGDTSNVTNMSYMFYSCSNLTTIPSLDTSNVTDMNSMFSSCSNLTTIPSFDTSNVTDMRYMFSSCSNLTTIPSFDTSNVTDMYSMFSYCSKLTSVPLLDTSNVTNMSYMFYRCSNLTTIPSFDTSNVTDMNSMFSYCIKLTTIHMKNMKVNFNISASTLFTRETLLEILNNLATVTSTQTLTMGNTNLAKLTDEDKVIATNKGWTLK